MRAARTACALAALLLTASGCATFVTSKPAQDNSSTPAKKNSGIEYALCLPAVEAVPQPDGRVAFKVICIPDPDHRYVIEGSTLFGSLTLNVKRNLDMTLEEVTIDADNSAVAAEAARTAGAIATKKIEAEAAAAKEKAAAEKAALEAAKKEADAAETALQSANVALDNAKADRAQAESELSSLLDFHGLSQGNAAEIVGNQNINATVRKEIRDALIEVQQKKAAVVAAEAAKERAQTAVAEANQVYSQAAASGNVASSANDPGATVWGPVIYRLEQTKKKNGELDDVRLVEMFSQKEIATIKVSAPPAKLSGSVSGVVLDPNKKAYFITVAFSSEIDTIDKDYTKLLNGRTQEETKVQDFSLAKDKKSVTLQFPSDLGGTRDILIVDAMIGTKPHSVTNDIDLGTATPPQ